MTEGRNQQQNNPGQSQSGMGQQQQSDTGRSGQQGGVSGLGDADASRASGQQGGQSSAGQQQQFDKSSSQQGGGGSDSRFADQIREHQEVVDDAGNHVGTVDHIDGDRIKLSRKDSSDGQHHYVQLSQVAGIEGDKVRLRERGDNDFGQSR